MCGDTVTPTPERQLQDVVVRILRFCTTTLRSASAKGPSVSSAAGGPALIPTKVIAECALLARCAANIPRPGFALGDLTNTLTIELGEAARPDTLPLALAFDAADLPEHVFAHVQLTCLGSLDAAIDELAELAWRARDVRGLERSTLHEIEATWIRAIWNGDPRPPFTTGPAGALCAGTTARRTSSASCDDLRVHPRRHADQRSRHLAGHPSP